MAAARRVFSDGKLTTRDRKLLKVESASTVGLRHVIFRKISASQSSEKNGEYDSVVLTPSCGDREQLDNAVRHFPSALSQQMKILNEEYLGLQEELEVHQQELQTVKEHLEDLEKMRKSLKQQLDFLHSIIQTQNIESKCSTLEATTGYFKRFVNHNNVLKFVRNLISREK